MPSFTEHINLKATILQGVTFPTATSMISKWVPNMERTTLGAFVLAGTQFGTVIGLPLSGWLCSVPLDNGWPLTFYVPGIVGVLWFIGWALLVYDNPSVHPTISIEEKNYILASTPKARYKPVRLFDTRESITNEN